MPDLINVAFASRPTARLNSGLASALPATPAGLGDAYYATDTGVLYLTTAGSSWDKTLDLDIAGVAPGTSGNVLTSNGSAWTSAAPVTAFYGVKANRSSQTGLVSGSDYTLAFDQADSYDSDTMHDTSTNNTRLIAKNAGKWSITATVLWASNLAAASGVWVRFPINGSGVNFALSGHCGGSLSGVAELALNDYIEMTITQYSGADRDINEASFGMEWRGA